MLTFSCSVESELSPHSIVIEMLALFAQLRVIDLQAGVTGLSPASSITFFHFKLFLWRQKEPHRVRVCKWGSRLDIDPSEVIPNCQVMS